MREIVSVFLSLAFAATLIFAILSLVFPQITKNRKSGHIPSRKYLIKAYAIILPLEIVALVVAIPPLEKNNKIIIDAASPGALKDAAVGDGENIKNLWISVLNASRKCDEFGESVTISLSSGDRYSAFETVKKASSACRHTYSEIASLEVPDIENSALHKDLENAKISCEKAYSVKHFALEEMLNVLDGDLRPSAVANAKGKMSDSSEAISSCVVDFMKVGGEAGVDLSKLS